MELLLKIMKSDLEKKENELKELQTSLEIVSKSEY